MEQKIKFIRICKDNDMKPAEAFALLIDFYDMVDADCIQIARTNIAKAIQRGVTPVYVKQLKLLFEYLIIFLKRINELQRR